MAEVLGYLIDRVDSSAGSNTDNLESQTGESAGSMFVITAVAISHDTQSTLTLCQEDQERLRKTFAPEQGEILFIAQNGTDAAQAIEHLMATHAQRDAEPKKVTIKVPNLTPRELEVLHVMARGYTSTEIANLLEMSRHTVHSHIKHMFRKLNVNSRSEAVFEATQLGIIQLRK